MQKDLVSRRSGTPIGEFINVSGSHEDDFQWFNFPGLGRGHFNLIGAELDEFVTLCVKAALKNGCVPIADRPDDNWRPTYAYGVTDEEIAANMVASWHALGRDPEWGELMFSWKDWIDPDAYAEWMRRREEAGAR